MNYFWKKNEKKTLTRFARDLDALQVTDGSASRLTLLRFTSPNSDALSQCGQHALKISEFGVIFEK